MMVWKGEFMSNRDELIKKAISYMTIALVAISISTIIPMSWQLLALILVLTLVPACKIAYALIKEYKKQEDK